MDAVPSQSDAIVLRSIRWSEGGRRVDFEADASGAAARYFAGLPPMFVRYGEDLSDTPASVAVLAWLGSVLPIAWLGGIEVVVPELDEVFAQSEPALRAQFAQRYPGQRIEGRLRALRVVRQIDKSTQGPPLMLFSGGLDAMATFLRRRDERPSLVTVLGGDIRLDQSREWRECMEHIRDEPVLKGFERLVVESNFREFYHLPVVERHLHANWWGSVQFGTGFICLLIPLARRRCSGVIYIASSIEGVSSVGSSEAVDSLVHWGGGACHHDSAGVPRPAKARELVAAARRLGVPIRVRVCWMQPEGWLNCGRCEKCLRTAINFIAAGADPERFGVPMGADFYPRLMRTLAAQRRKDVLEPVWQENTDAVGAALANGGAFLRPGSPADRAWLTRIAAGEPVRILRLSRTSVGRKWKRLQLRLARWIPWLDPGRE
ncbi:MAG: hypothetical protein ACO23N_03075 [Opitutales bacterium]